MMEEIRRVRQISQQAMNGACLFRNGRPGCLGAVKGLFGFFYSLLEPDGGLSRRRCQGYGHFLMGRQFEKQGYDLGRRSGLSRTGAAGDYRKTLEETRGGGQLLPIGILFPFPSGTT